MTKEKGDVWRKVMTKEKGGVLHKVMTKKKGLKLGWPRNSLIETSLFV